MIQNKTLNARQPEGSGRERRMDLVKIREGIRPLAGYLYIWQSQMLEEFNYYPFVLTFKVTCAQNLQGSDLSKSPALEKSSEQRYNSQFIQQDEFVDANGQTYGMEDYDFAFRNYDPQIGRWMQPDPLMQHASPYLAMSNNPVLFTDPSGLWDLNEVVITADRPYWMSYEGYFDSPGQNPFDRSNLMADMVYENGAKYRKADQVTDVFGKVQNHGAAYGRGNYWANELASWEIQKNNGFNSSLINSGKGSDYFYKAGGILLGATGFVTQNAEMFAKVQIATEARRTGNIVNAVKKLNDLEPLGKFTRKLGYVGVAFSVAKLGNDLLSGKELKSSQILDLGINITLSVLTISNPVAIVGLGVYSVMDAYGVFDKYKEKYID